MIPKSRFDEVNEQLKELKAAQEKAQRAQAAAEQARLEKQNEFKTLYEQSQQRIAELEPYQQRINELTEATAATNAQRIEALPESMRSLVPEYDDPFKLQGWLDKNAEVFSKPAAPTLNGGAGSGQRSQRPSNAPSEQELREQAARLGVNARYLAEQYGVQLTQG
jgi:exonuclease VII large subunit